MGADWMEEGRGVLPVWPNARLIDGRVVLAIDRIVYTYVPNDVLLLSFGASSVGEHFDSSGSTARLTGTPPHLLPPIDLADPDVCAALDRRLALRLGAPEEAVREGVVACCVFPDGRRPRGTKPSVLYVGAGVDFIEGYAGASVPSPVWSKDVPVDTDDPILARVRAWKSVSG